MVAASLECKARICFCRLEWIQVCVRVCGDKAVTYMQSADVVEKSKFVRSMQDKSEGYTDVSRLLSV